MASLTLFKSRAPSIGYVFRNGHTVHFVNGEYATSSKVEIEELTTECEAGHPCYYIDAKELTTDSEVRDPLAALKAQIREEERVKILASMDRDMGKTENAEKLVGIANSRTIVGLVSDSISQAGVAAGSVKVATATATKV